MMDKFNKVNDVHNNDYIFYRIKGIILNEDYVSKNFKVAVTEAGLNDNIHFHILRH